MKTVPRRSRKKQAPPSPAPSREESSLQREVKPTLVKPLPPEREESREAKSLSLLVGKLIEEEKRILVERAKLLAEGVIHESYTAFLGLKVRPTVKKLWDAAPLEVKRAAKQALEATILAYYLGGRASLGTHLYHAPPIVLNLNIVNAQAKAEARFDIKPVLELLDELRSELTLIRNLAQHSRDRNAHTIYERTENLLRIIERERGRMERLAYN